MYVRYILVLPTDIRIPVHFNYPFHICDLNFKATNNSLVSKDQPYLHTAFTYIPNTKQFLQNVTKKIFFWMKTYTRKNHVSQN